MEFSIIETSEPEVNIKDKQNEIYRLKHRMNKLMIGTIVIAVFLLAFIISMIILIIVMNQRREKSSEDISPQIYELTKNNTFLEKQNSELRKQNLELISLYKQLNKTNEQLNQEKILLQTKLEEISFNESENESDTMEVIQKDENLDVNLETVLKQIVEIGFGEYQSNIDRANFIQTQLTKELTGNWNCLIFKVDFCNYTIARQVGSYILLKYQGLRVAIYLSPVNK